MRWGMPRYFFDITIGRLKVHDEEGIALADDEVACEQAAAALPEIALEAPSAPKPEKLVLVVRNEEGALIFCGETATRP
jgi:hypothetical protein